MTPKGRVLASLNHREPEAVPLDFGSTAVTGIHVAAVAELRDYYDLERRPVKVYEPYQMLGLIEDDLKGIMGIDVEGIPAPETLFGFRNENWKPWTLQSGLEVLVSEHFQTTKDKNGDTLIYPKGDLSAPVSRHARFLSGLGRNPVRTGGGRGRRSHFRAPRRQTPPAFDLDRRAGRDRAGHAAVGNRGKRISVRG